MTYVATLQLFSQLKYRYETLERIIQSNLDIPTQDELKIVNMLARTGKYYDFSRGKIMCFSCAFTLDINPSYITQEEIKYDSDLYLHNPDCWYPQLIDTLSNQRINSKVHCSFVADIGNSYIYYFEAHRLATFIDWPVPWISPLLLAQNGLYYLRTESQCVCFSCGMKVNIISCFCSSSSSSSSSQLDVHHFSTCLFIYDSRMSGNISLNTSKMLIACLENPSKEYVPYQERDQVESFLKDMMMMDEEEKEEEEEEGKEEEEEEGKKKEKSKRKKKEKEKDLPHKKKLRRTTSTSTSSSFSLYYRGGIDYNNKDIIILRRPALVKQHSQIQNRIQSFGPNREWTFDRHVSPPSNAWIEAGFFYQNYGDAVMCYSCGVSIHNIEFTDEPKNLHANNCYFATIKKYPIKLRKKRNEIKQTFKRLCKPDLNDFCNSYGFYKYVVDEMKYDCNLVMRIIQTRLIKQGFPFMVLDDFIDKIKEAIISKKKRSSGSSQFY